MPRMFLSRERPMSCALASARPDAVCQTREARTHSAIPTARRRLMRARFGPIALLLTISASFLSFASCSRATRGPQRPATTVLIDNRSSHEMTIYVWRGAERMRLGTARAINETRLTLPSGMVFGGTSLRFQADPIGSNRAPISSEILVHEGDQVVLRIPPY